MVNYSGSIFTAASHTKFSGFIHPLDAAHFINIKCMLCTYLFVRRYNFSLSLPLPLLHLVGVAAADVLPAPISAILFDLCTHKNMCNILMLTIIISFFSSNLLVNFVLVFDSSKTIFCYNLCRRDRVDGWRAIINSNTKCCCLGICCTHSHLTNNCCAF